jgi:uncharacterized protein YjbI with pentapeptide repeats
MDALHRVTAPACLSTGWTRRTVTAQAPGVLLYGKEITMTDVLTRHAVIARIAAARQRRRSPQLVGANLAQAALAGLNLERALLQGANLHGANLAGTSLAGAYLQGANLTGANLAGANLAGANFSQANLAGANLTDADLEGTNFSQANLDDTTLNGTQLGRAYLGIRDIDRATTAHGPFTPPWRYGTQQREPV